MANEINRCAWANVNDPLIQYYHDNKWGRPLHGDRQLFELLSLEIMQAGLSWRTVLHKKAAFEADFHNFRIHSVAHMASDLPKLLTDPRIIRNRLKLKAIVHNAQVVDQLRQTSAGLDRYLWKFVNYQPIINHYRVHADVPKQTALSRHISKIMKADGFKFTGPVTIYSFMEASGMVNDHTMNCFLRN